MGGGGPPPSPASQPHQALLTPCVRRVRATSVALVQAIAEAGIDRVWAHAFAVGREHEAQDQRQRAALPKRVALTEPPPSAASVSYKVDRIAMLDQLVSQTAIDAGAARMLGAADAAVAADAAMFSLSSPTPQPQQAAKASMHAERMIPHAPQSVRAAYVAVASALVDACSNPWADGPITIDEGAYRHYQFRRLLPVHLVGGGMALCLLYSAPEAVLPIYAASRGSLLQGLALLLGLRLGAHRALSPAHAQRSGSALASLCVSAALLSLACHPHAAGGQQTASSVSRGIQAALTLTLCGSMHAFALPLSARGALVVISLVFVRPSWPFLKAVDRNSTWLIMHMSSSLTAFAIDQYLRQEYQKKALDSPPATSSGTDAASPVGRATPPTPPPAPTAVAPPSRVGRGGGLVIKAPPPSASSVPSGGGLVIKAAETPPEGGTPTLAAERAGSPRTLTLAAERAGSPRSGTPKGRLLSLGAVALKPHALGKLPSLPMPSLTMVELNEAVHTQRTGAEEELEVATRWQQQLRLHLGLLAVRGLVVYFLASTAGPSAQTLLIMPFPVAMLILRVVLVRAESPVRASQLFGQAWVVEAWLMLLVPASLILCELISPARVPLCASQLGKLDLGPTVGALPTGAKRLLLAWLCFYPFILANCVTSWLSRLLIILPRMGRMVVLWASNAENTPTTLELMLMISAFGSGCLASYVSELTSRLQRQNGIRRENSKLRAELRASLSAVSESRDHIRELQKLVGDSSSSNERQILSKVFDAQSLPRAILRTRIDFAELTVLGVLGQGNFGQVHLGQWRTSRVACKVMHRSRLTAHVLDVVVRSVEVSLGLRSHPNVVDCFGMAWELEKGRVLLAMELCEGGTLAAALERAASGERELGWASHKFPIATGIAQGLAFLHGQQPPVVHRDIKPDNIMLQSDLRRAKIADLGLCRELIADTAYTFNVGTPLFTAPEALVDGPGSYDQSADVWSFGCVLACMQSNHNTPYEIPASESLLLTVTAGHLRPEVPAHSPVHDLVRDCCQRAGQRPSAEQAAARLLEAGARP